MIAVDTNILVRYAVNDEPVQSQQAKVLLKNTDAIFISKITLLEFEWVLRSAYKLSRELILHSILTICGLPNITVESAWQVAQACELYSKGLVLLMRFIIIQRIPALTNSIHLTKNLLETANY